MNVNLPDVRRSGISRLSAGRPLRPIRSYRGPRCNWLGKADQPLFAGLRQEYRQRVPGRNSESLSRRPAPPRQEPRPGSPDKRPRKHCWAARNHDDASGQRWTAPQPRHLVARCVSSGLRCRCGPAPVFSTGIGGSREFNYGLSTQGIKILEPQCRSLKRTARTGPETSLALSPRSGRAGPRARLRPPSNPESLPGPGAPAGGLHTDVIGASVRRDRLDARSSVRQRRHRGAAHVDSQRSQRGDDYDLHPRPSGHHLRRPRACRRQLDAGLSTGAVRAYDPITGSPGSHAAGVPTCRPVGRQASAGGSGRPRPRGRRTVR